MKRHTNRRSFVLSTSSFMALLASCGQQVLTSSSSELSEFKTSPSNLSLNATVDMYDTYAMATYYDGSLGPKTGICKVDDVIANQPVTLAFWHGHGGKQHAFTILPEHFTDLRHGKKVVIETTAVDGHRHKLFIDPTNPKWRVPGSKPVAVPIEPVTEEPIPDDGNQNY